MKQKPQSPAHPVRRWYRRLWLWLPLALVALVAIAVLLLPFGIRYGLERWLQDQGVQARIDGVDFNLFRGHLALRGVQIRADGQPVLVLPRADLGFALRPLWQRRIVIDTVSLRDIALTIEHDAKAGWRVAGLARAVPAVPKSKNSSWEFSIRRVEIAHGVLDYRGAGQSAQARLERAEWVADARGDGAVASGPMRVRLSGDWQWQRETPAAAARGAVTTNLVFTPADGKTKPWRLEGNGELREIDVRRGAQEPPITTAQRLAFDKLDLRGPEALALGTLTLEGWMLYPPRAEASELGPLLRAGHARADGVQRHGGVWHIAEVTLSDLFATARRERDKAWYGIAPVREFLASLVPAEPKKSGGAWRIDNLVVEKPATVDFGDLSVDPVFRTRLSLTRAHVTGLDTGAEPAAPTRLAISARIGKYSTARLTGDVRRFTPRLTAALQMKLRELDLPALSGYAAPSLGYRIVSGQLNADFDLDVSADKLDGKGKFTFANFSVKPQEGQSAEARRVRTSLPLESGIGMLRDKNNNVNLEVNVSGNVGDPQFDLTDAINQALNRAIRTASVSYLKFYFQPFGTLITVAELAGKASQLRLNPVYYGAGSDQPVPDMADYLRKVGGLLQERQNLRLKLCPKSAPLDGPDEAAARALSQRRADKLKDRLAADYGIATDRLFVCAPELDRDAAAQPRVELLL